MPFHDRDVAVDGGGSYLSAHDPRLVLGLSKRSKLDWLEVKWPQPGNTTERFTGLYPKLGRQITTKCVDCHMPKQQTNLNVSDWNGRKVRPQVRNHWIKVYPETRVP